MSVDRIHPAEPAATFAPAADLDGLAAQAEGRRLNDAPAAADPDVRSLQHTVLDRKSVV